MGMWLDTWLPPKTDWEAQAKHLEAQLEDARTELKRWRALQPGMDQLADLVGAEPGEAPHIKAVIKIKALQFRLAEVEQKLEELLKIVKR
jgi:hypothetical protein